MSILPLRRQATCTSKCVVVPEDCESGFVTWWKWLSDTQSWPSGDVRLEMSCDDHSTLAGTKGNEGTILSRSWDVFPFHNSLRLEVKRRFSGGRNRAVERPGPHWPREGGQLFSLDACSGISQGEQAEPSSPKKWRVTRDESGPHRGGAAAPELGRLSLLLEASAARGTSRSGTCFLHLVYIH